MRQVILGIVIGLTLAAGSTLAVEGIDPFWDQMQRNNERFEAERERYEQRSYRDEQRRNELMRTPC